MATPPRGIQNIFFGDRTLAIVWFVTLLLATVMFFLSWEGPIALEERAAKLLKEVRVLQDQKADDAQVEHTLMVHLMEGARDSHWLGMARHISLALFVSCILMLAVDVHTRRVARADLRHHLDAISNNVFAAVSKRLVGDRITRELDLVLRQEFAKANCGYRITFQSPLKAGCTDWVVLLVENWYEIRRLSESSFAPFQFEATLIGQETAEASIDNKTVKLPRFHKVVIDGDEKNADALSDSQKSRTINMPLKVSADPARPTHVYLAIQVACRVHSFDVMYSDCAVEGSSFEVNNQVPQLIGKIEVSVLHPAYKEVVSHAQGTWQFDRCLLPGQGWYISWKPA